MKEFDVMEEATGEYHDTYSAAPHATDATNTILVLITTICLILSIFIVMYRLVSEYDLFKSPQDILNRQRNIEKTYMEMH